MIKQLHNLQREYLHGDKLRAASDFFVTEAEPVPKDLGARSGVIFCHTHFLDDLFRALAGSKQRYLLISHNSDYGVTRPLVERKPSCIKAWYAQNVIDGCGFVTPLPIGMERPGIASSGDITIIHKQWMQKRERWNLVYMSMNPNTNVDARWTAIHALEGRSYVTYRPLEQRVPFPSFIEEMYHHPFVISPPGNGLDCIRTWEALYLGVIPIVLDSYMAAEFADLPMLFVSNYADLDEQQLEQTYLQMMSREWNLSKMTTSYWLKRIRLHWQEIEHANTAEL